LAYLSQPASDRVLYRAIRKWKVRRIMEIGIGDLRRGQKMVRLAQRYHPGAEVRYVGVDLFEARDRAESAGLSLKQAYRMLRATGARVHLIPSDAIQSLVRSANALPGNELVIVAADQAAGQLAQAWFYIPRMLAPSALLYSADVVGAKFAWRKMSVAELPSRAEVATYRRAA
jgi:hypothetical protein